jgi:GNAT superfamily N-acetyltransferase
MARIISARPYRNGDELQLVDLWNLCFNRLAPLKTEESWRWRYLHYPGFRSDGVWVAEHEGRIIGSLVTTSKQVTVRGQTYTFAMTDEVATHPQFRGWGVYRQLREDTRPYRRALKADAEGGYVAYNTSTYNAATQLGYLEVAPVTRMIKIINPRQLFTKLPALPAGYLSFKHLQSSHRRREEIDSAMDIVEPRIERPSRELMAFIASHSTNEIGRNLLTDAYLKWKYETETRESESRFVVFRKERVEALAHLSIKTYFYADPGRYRFKAGVLEDILVTDPASLPKLIETAVSYARGKGVLLIKANIDTKNSRILQRLSNAGFQQIRPIIGMYLSRNPSLKFERMTDELWYVPSECVEGEP